MNNKQRVKIYISLLIVVLLTMGTSYAYFITTKQQTNNNTVATMQCFTATYSEEEGTDISITKAMPKTNANGMLAKPYQFSISNTCSDTLLKVTIYMINNNSTIDMDYVRVGLNERDDTTDKSFVISDKTYQKVANDQYGYKIGVAYLTGNQTIDYDVRLWIDSLATFEEVSGKVFEGKIYTVIEPAEQATPTKGDVIVIDAGDGLPNEYKIIKIDDTIAEVVAVNNAVNNMAYSTVTADDNNPLQYENSNIDTYLNTTFYNSMNQVLQRAIIPQNINACNTITQKGYMIPEGKKYYINNTRIYELNKYSPIGIPNSLVEDSCTQLSNRYIYLLGLSDISDYYNTNEFHILFNGYIFKSNNTSYASSELWLRDTTSNTEAISIDLDEDYNSQVYYGNHTYDTQLAIRPAFTVDLSKIKYERTNRIIFNENGGKINSNISNCDYSTITDISGITSNSYTLPTTTFFKTSNEDKKFGGWSLTSNGSIISSITFTKPNNILYAIWIDKTLQDVISNITFSEGNLRLKSSVEVSLKARKYIYSSTSASIDSYTSYVDYDLEKEEEENYGYHDLVEISIVNYTTTIPTGGYARTVIYDTSGKYVGEVPAHDGIISYDY